MGDNRLDKGQADKKILTPLSMEKGLEMGNAQANRPTKGQPLGGYTRLPNPGEVYIFLVKSRGRTHEVTLSDKFRGVTPSSSFRVVR